MNTLLIISRRGGGATASSLWRRSIRATSSVAAASLSSCRSSSSNRCHLTSTGVTAVSAFSSASQVSVPRRRAFGSTSEAKAEEEEQEVQQPYVTLRRQGLRNVAIIAHVDHGKTTLVDQLLTAAAASGEVKNAASLDRLLDSSDLEKERGITITSKVTRLDYTNRDQQRLIINCVDTPGHSDFSAEVDRILSMVDGVVLVCDAAEGPKSQTKYVLTRAISMNLKPLVVLNKCDRSDAIAGIDSGETEAKLSALFQSLGGDDSYRTLYASAREGWITEDPTEALDLAETGYDAANAKHVGKYSMANLLHVIEEEIPEPAVRSYCPVDDSSSEQTDSRPGEAFQDDVFSLATVTVGYDPYLGRTCTGRIFSGSIQVNDPVMIVRRQDGEQPVDGATASVSGIFVYEGINRIPLMEPALAGDIVTLTGIPDFISVGDTVTGRKNPILLPIDTPPLAPPTLAMDFGANNGPLAGREGTKIASSQIRSRLLAEADNNVTLKVQPCETDSEKTTVFARGELQLGILVETMRREGFELVISPPRIVTRRCPETGATLEPYEEVTVDVDSEYSSAVVSALTGDRKGLLIASDISSSDGKSRLVFEIPTRGLLGVSSEVATATKGSAVVNHLFLEDRKHAGSLGSGLTKGKLVSNDSGKATAYALESLSQRGTLFIGPSDLVYPGMVIGENAKPGDLTVNPVRQKDKTNIRSQNKDEKLYLAPPKHLSVEELIGYMENDELIEVTPMSIRLRKELMDPGARERAARTKAKQQRAAKDNKA